MNNKTKVNNIEYTTKKDEIYLRQLTIMNFDGNLCVDPRENGEKRNQNIICCIIPYASFFLAFPALQVCSVACHFSKKARCAHLDWQRKLRKDFWGSEQMHFFYFVIAECVTVSIILSNVDKDYVITSNLMRHQPWKKGKGYFFKNLYFFRNCPLFFYFENFQNKSSK